MLKSRISRSLCAALLLCSCALCWADTVVLKEGQSLTGDILAEKDEFIYMDIGVEVLKIPREKILDYEYAFGESSLQIEDVDANMSARKPMSRGNRPVSCIEQPASRKQPLKNASMHFPRPS